jgi:hypothetical protein
MQARLRSGAVNYQNDWVVLRPIWHETLTREIARGLRKAFLCAVVGAVVDLCALDVRENFTCAVMKGADRAAFYPMCVETGSVELLQRVSPVGKPTQFSWPQPNNPCTKTTWFDFIDGFSNLQLALGWQRSGRNRSVAR